MTDALLAAILILLLLIFAGGGVALIWRMIAKYEERLARLEKILDQGDKSVPYWLRNAILDLEAPLVHTLVQGKADYEAYLARTQRALQIYQDLYNGIYVGHDKPEKGKK
jgi:hypothetical protein